MTWQPMPRPSGVLAVHHIEEASTPLVRLDRKNLPDLDELVLWLSTVDEYGEPSDEYDSRWSDEFPTATGGALETRTWWARISPCSCGSHEHAWHVEPGLRHGDDPTEEPHRRGVFLAVGGEW